MDEPTPDSSPPVQPLGPESSDLEAMRRLGEGCRRVMAELSRVIVGQHTVIEELLISLLAGGHALLVGVPGLAKTLAVQSLAKTLRLDFDRIQFTPDLMPADITGTEVIQQDRETGERTLKFLRGPIFTQVLLADEINRTPPKTQAALLEAMQEHQVTAGGQRHQLPEPFFVLATQNPIEQEGTYPLPEAQLDRFMLQILVDYPPEDDEFRIVRETTREETVTLDPVLSAEEIAELRSLTRRIPVADSVIRYAMRLVRQTRVGTDDLPEFLKGYLRWGAGPRASQALVLAAKARAVLKEKPQVLPEDIDAVAKPVLRHRLLLTFNAEADGVTADDLIDRLVKQTPAHPEGDRLRDRLPGLFRSSRDR